MPARLLRNTVILAKLETTYGVDSVPTGAANALLVSAVSITPLVADNVPRDLVRGYLGGSEQLVGLRRVEMNMTVELAGSGTPTTAPAWGPLLQACGFAGAAGTASFDYTPVSTFGASSSVTIYYYLDGQLHILRGARGTFTLNLGMGERPVMNFRFLGIDGGLTAAANATSTLTAWRTPVAVVDANSPGLRFGAVTYTASTGVVASGTVYISRGLQIDAGLNPTFQGLLGEESVEITEREVTGSMSLNLTAADAVSFMTAVKANTLGALGFTHGTVAGNIIVVHAPAVQRINPTVDDFNGQALHTYQLRMVPVSGNDELRIVSR
jgi:hypothetical protein